MQDLCVMYRPGPDADRTYSLSFPASELANAIALCGWTLANDLGAAYQSSEIATRLHGELEKLKALGSLPIPEDPRAWFAAHASMLLSFNCGDCGAPTQMFFRVSHKDDSPICLDCRELRRRHALQADLDRLSDEDLDAGAAMFDRLTA